MKRRKTVVLALGGAAAREGIMMALWRIWVSLGIV